MMIKRLLLSVLCLLSLPTLGQEVNTSAKEQVSDAFLRSALSIMTYADALETEDPLVLAGALLDTAVELNPDNAQAWSLRAELAQTAGDQEAYEQALVGYLDTGIDDDRARFNLIQFRLASNDTLDGKLREVEDLLNSEAGRGLSGPLRSQLATFAFSIADELLDERARRKWAVEAARADPTNKQAAQTMLDLVTELGGDAVRRGTATVNVIRADPLGPAPRIALASLLAEHGAFTRAAQQYQVVSTRLTAEPLPLPAYTNWAHCLAMTGQDELLLQLLDEFEAALNPTPIGPDAPPAEEGQPENPAGKIDLPIGLALIRLAVLLDGDDPDQAQVVFDQIARQLEADAEDDEDTTELKRENLVMIAAVFGPDREQATQIVKNKGNDPVALGWLALRAGDKAKARDLLGPEANEVPLAACGMAIATAQDGPGQARLLQSFIESASTSSLAALAAGRAMLETQTPPQANTTGKAMLALMAKYPEAFWRVDVERTPWLDVRLRIKPQRIKPLQPIKAELTLWNTSRFPLAISEDGPINQNAIVTINATNLGRMLPPSSPIVIDLGRKFSLKAGERMIMDVRLDYHQFGSLRAQNPGAAFAFDARLFVNPTLTPAGTWLPSGIGAVSEVRDCLAEARPPSDAAIDSWLTLLADDVPSKKLFAMQRLAKLNRANQSELVNTVLPKIEGPVLSAYEQGTLAERAWIILNAVDLSKDDTTYPELLQRALASDSELVWMALMVSHVATPSEAEMKILRAGIGKQNMPDVARFAERQKRLVDDIAEYVAKQEAEAALEAGR